MSDETTVDKQETTADTPREAELPAFSAGMDSKPGAEISGDKVDSIELLRDVNLELTVELGRTRMNIGEIMDLGQGSVVELDKMAGEPVDVRVNGVLLASGEVIVLDDVFGVRITRLHNRVDRMATFGD
jgi:flagellar motor switch protein FliN